MERFTIEWFTERLLELGFESYLGKKLEFVRYNPGWDYKCFISLHIPIKPNYHNRLSYKSEVTNAKVNLVICPDTKRGIVELFNILGEPLMIGDNFVEGYGFKKR